MTIISMRVALASVALAIPASVRGQVVGAPTPDSLAHLVMSRLTSGTPDAFDSMFPDPLGRTVVRNAVEQKTTRLAGLARVVSRSPDRAVLLLSATLRSGTVPSLEAGGDETNRVRRLAGFYEAVRTGGSWSLTRQLPLDTGTTIEAQTLHVALTPGTGVRIVDTLTLGMRGPYGVAVRLNNAARVASVTVDGQPARFAFGGGLLWVEARSRRPGRLVLRYAIPDHRDTVPTHGALHNTDIWHPFFNYDSGNDFAKLSITVTLPARYRLTTSVPQTETVRDGVRTVHGESGHAQFLLALIYDSEWAPTTVTRGGMRVETFVRPAFRFTPDSLATVVAAVNSMLTTRFGEPPGSTHYIAVVEDRNLEHSAFNVRMNDAVVAGDDVQMLDEPTLGPAAAFAHEVSHGWTMNASGLAANMLREGWATFAEATWLRAAFGPATERAFWDKNSTSYFRYDGKLSILGAPDNGRVHYTKGSWVLHALNTTLGDSVFDRGMREYVARQGLGPDGYEELIAAMSHAAGRDMTPFIMPWLTEKWVPDVDARVEGKRLIVSQVQPEGVFDLPLDIELTTSNGPVRLPVHLTTRSDTVELGDVGTVTDANPDPDHHFLMRRHRGEVVRFALTAPAAKAVEITGTFSLTPIKAAREGDQWTVTMPLIEGRYVYIWHVDGVTPSDNELLAAARAGPSDTAHVGVRIVRPLQRIEDAHAK